MRNLATSSDSEAMGNEMKSNAARPRIVSFVLSVIFALAGSGSAHAGMFSRAKTEGQRLDDAAPVSVEGIYIYSFLQEGADISRLSKDIEAFRQLVSRSFQSKGIRVGSRDMPRGALVLNTTPHGPGGVSGYKRVLEEESKASAADHADEYREEELALSANYRLLLLPDQVVRSTGVRWGVRAIPAGAGSWMSRGPQSTGVPSYSFRVFWLLEDVDGEAVAGGTTTAILDIRGFPARQMSEQIIGELESLGIRWSAR